MTSIFSLFPRRLKPIVRVISAIGLLWITVFMFMSVSKPDIKSHNLVARDIKTNPSARKIHSVAENEPEVKSKTKLDNVAPNNDAAPEKDKVKAPVAKPTNKNTQKPDTNAKQQFVTAMPAPKNTPWVDPWKKLRVSHKEYRKAINSVRQQSAGYVQKLTPEMAPIRTEEERLHMCDDLADDTLGVYTAQKVLQGKPGEYNCSHLMKTNLCRKPPPHIFTFKGTPGKPRILCWILSSQKDTRKEHLKATWTQRCDMTIFAAGGDSDFPTLGLGVPDNREHIVSKAVAMWMYIYLHFLDQFDFFYKADPDTYAIVDNLRDFLSDKDPGLPLYYGNIFHIWNIPWWRFASGGPGEVLSRTAVRVLVEHSYRKYCDQCIPDGRCEDCKLGRCLMFGGVNISDSRDEKGRERFLPLFPSKHLFLEEGGGMYRQFNLFRGPEGHDCCAEYPISFHYVTPDQMYLLDYLLYRWKVKAGPRKPYDSFPPLPRLQAKNVTFK